ncbi:xanthine dehydrogenase family protein molybdopterin-binding subunit [Steroidobacter cummioxidans]|uniref:xanthine dehydrogenase family protein molybdopterin-binding subunit n=1 Tax=Steroidobacter cummioxidans TaxID=1803913 RepID=UPI000E31ADFA|nr:molybdopterin cofactor-binding domain-containing protein [Steroidobacter cummioxidans]
MMTMNRRDFMRSAALAVGGLTLCLDTLAREVTLAPGAATARELGDFIRITPSGDVLFQFVKHEMGQGVATSMAQILCEELCADWERVQIDFPIADLPRYQNDRNGGLDTGGSCTIIYQYDLLRKAGATARQMLVAAAAQQWQVPTRDCIADNHWVIHRSSGRKLAFGDLATAAAALPMPANVELKDPQRFVLIGRSKAAKLIPEIVTGRLQFGIDVRVPGMLYAVIARCPVFKGKLKRFDASAALKVPGVRKVFDTRAIAGPQPVSFVPHDIREGVVVVADSFWAALQGRNALQIEWDEGANAQRSSEDFERFAAERALVRDDPTGYLGDENASADLSRVGKVLRASYVYPQQLHSCMEPLNCTAHVRPEGCEVWLGSQAPNLVIEELQKLLRLEQSSIKLHLLPSGGGFGRRYYTDMAVEAAYISREAGNVPVKMLWTREDDQQCNLAHHFQHMEYQAALDKQRKLYAWYEKELRTYTWAARYQDPTLPSMAYDIPNIRYDFEDLGPYELLQSSAWRGVVNHGKALSECFIDEIAAELKIDPYQFRLSLLTPGRTAPISSDYSISSDRMRGVLMLAAQKAGWGKSMERGRGMGIALAPYASTYTCAIAEVTVRERKLQIDRITLAVDCGRVINPSGADQQLVGGIVWSLTALLYGGAPIKNGRAVHANFHQNRLLRMNECPPIDVHLVRSPDDRPQGLGEMSAPLAVPAVLNAIYAATGTRIRKIPLPAEIPVV